MSEFFFNSEQESPERFDMAKFMDWALDDNYDPLTSRFFERMRKFDVGGKRLVQNSDARPDLLSKDLYEGDTQYWWIVLLYNNILKIDELYPDKKLNYISASDIEDFVFGLRVDQVSK